MSVAYTTRHSTTWHATPDCQALDDARLHEGEHVEVPIGQAADRRPCIVCATTPATEWTVTPDNLGELINLIDPSKPYWASTDDGLKCTGLTVREHAGMGTRQVAHFGDRIIYHPASRIYTVHPATKEQQ